MPDVAMSSSRPTKGLTKVAPTLAASSACAAVKTSVTFTLMPSDDKRLAGLNARLRERHLDDDVLVDLGEVASLAQHAVDVGRHDLRARRPLHDVADALQQRAIVPALLRQQRGIGGDAVDDAERHQCFDFLQIAGVDKELHGVPLTSLPTLPALPTLTELPRSTNWPHRQDSKSLVTNTSKTERLPSSRCSGSDLSS